MIRFFIVAVLLFAAGMRGHAGEFLDVPSGGNGRIANFYEAISAIDPKACQPILASLNKERLIDDRKLDAYPRVSLAVDAFLWSDLQVP